MKGLNVKKFTKQNAISFSSKVMEVEIRTSEPERQKVNISTCARAVFRKVQFLKFNKAHIIA